jgi:phosphatidylserine/phosphatidylglycerophosphate/cardiolipin synthase-like enzyme/uncharacterized membrane protein YdjX (TVP38/TMEM64 family)
MPILKEGRNCLHRKSARRVSALVDADDYFKAFEDAVSRAERQILIIGWDLDSRLELRRGEGVSKEHGLSKVLERAASEKPDLKIYVLVWDFAMLYAFEREPLPAFKFGVKAGSGLKFHSDGEHPLGASHHQKIVVVDDKLAFAGGLDLTRHRWDDRRHDPDNELRRDSAGKGHGPYHDVQMMVDGDAAAGLGDLARQRWLRARGERIGKPEGLTDIDPWPSWAAPDFENVRIALARTEPEFKGRPEIKEVEALWLDAVCEAEWYLYIENQYFTSQSVADALEESLQRPEGPEILMVMPHTTSGWLEQNVMGALRARLLEKLRSADEHGRFRACYPVVGQDVEVMVHSKVVVVDDRLLRVGSSNLSNRSMGLDTECDLAVEAENGEVRRGIADFRDGLIAEHLGCRVSELREKRERLGFLGAVESLRHGPRGLRELKSEKPEWLEQLDIKFADPEKPVKMDRLIDDFVQDQPGNGKKKALIGAAAALAVLAVLALAWRYTGLGEVVDLNALIGWIGGVRDAPTAVLLVVVFFCLGSLLVFPVTLLIAASGAVFAPLPAVLYALAGITAGAALNYYLGMRFGSRLLRRFPESKVHRLSERLAKRGVIAVAVVRNLPIAPFTVVNVVSGASHISFRDYMLGTLLGMLPGTVVLILFTEQIKAVIFDPGPMNIALAAGLGLALAVGSYLLKRRLTRKAAPGEPAAPEK